MSVVLIDYGSGNLRSAAKAFERVADAVVVTSDPDELYRASHIVLPGVGAFADCYRGLAALPGMLETLEEQVLKKGKPFLGICVGMQLLASWGREHGDHKGLGWVDGEVIPLKPSDPCMKIPHMGWNELILKDSDHPLLAGISSGAHAYFVHSYHFSLSNPRDQLVATDYGVELTAMLVRGNIAGTQFHPEKSQETGLTLLANFLKWHP